MKLPARFRFSTPKKSSPLRDNVNVAAPPSKSVHNATSTPPSIRLGARVKKFIKKIKAKKASATRDIVEETKQPHVDVKWPYRPYERQVAKFLKKKSEKAFDDCKWEPVDGDVAMVDVVEAGTVFINLSDTMDLDAAQEPQDVNMDAPDVDPSADIDTMDDDELAPTAPPGLQAPPHMCHRDILPIIDADIDPEPIEDDEDDDMVPGYAHSDTTLVSDMAGRPRRMPLPAEPAPVDEDDEDDDDDDDAPEGNAEPVTAAQVDNILDGAMLLIQQTISGNNG
ncbi:hypothetical protein EIP91_008215 [Steccherinum ochraceum]|uniref:Uncharacterized protein n=1 Tax=Steccherinum ochraceum TaxID=92696 RepID=A0A4R0RKP6_9APHY|nr:hypothetical protein EIP91_008215 [Steccherinum ochraceum]